MTEFKKRLFLLILSLTFSLVTMELLLAFLYPQETMKRAYLHAPRVFIPSDILPYALKPNSRGRIVTPEFTIGIDINSHGYRGKEFEIEKSGQFRILAIGDSFTYGYGVSTAQSYPEQLVDRLRQQFGVEKIEAINAGFAACYYPDTYYLYLKEEGLKLDQDLILIGFFIGNDIDHEAIGENVWVQTDAKGLPLKIESVNSVVENGYVVANHKRWRYRFPILRNSHLVQASVAALAKFAAIVNSQVFFNHWMYRKGYLERTDEAVQKVQKLFTGMMNLAKERNIPLVVIMIPTREQCYPGEYPFNDYPYMKDYDLEKPQRIFARFFEKEGINYLDLLPFFRQEPLDQPLYYKKDLHLNRYGYEVMAQKIADYLMGHNFIRVGVQKPTE